MLFWFIYRQNFELICCGKRILIEELYLDNTGAYEDNQGLMKGTRMKHTQSAHMKRILPETTP